MDQGRTEIDHRQVADRRQPSLVPPAVVAPAAPSADPLALPSARVRRPRREWYRGSEPSEFDRFMLERVVVPRRDPHARPPQAPWHYLEDEVKEARDITGRWMALLLEGMDYEEIFDWRECLDPLSVRSFIVDFPNAPEHAIELHAAGITVRDLRWRPEDQGWGTLPDRLRRRTMSVAEVITEVRYRRAEDAS